MRNAYRMLAIRLLPLLFLACSSVSGQTKYGHFSIQVIDPGGRPLSEAQVAVKSAGCNCRDCEKPEECKCCPDEFVKITGPDGTVIFELPTGEYWVAAMLEGIGAASREIRVQRGETSRLTLVLQSKVGVAAIKN